MAYSGKLECSNLYDAWTKLIRFLTSDPNTPGKDWIIDKYTLDTTTANNVQAKPYSGTIQNVVLNQWYELPTISVHDHSFKVGGVEIDPTYYTLDAQLGKVMFTHQSLAGANVDYSYNFRRADITLRNVGYSGTEAIYCRLKLYIHTSDSEGHVTLGGATGKDSLGNLVNARLSRFAVPIWNNPNYLWIFSNRQRIIIVNSSEAYYNFGYVGFALRLALPTEYVYPFVICGSGFCDGVYSSFTWHNSSANRWPLYASYAYYRDDGAYFEIGSGASHTWGYVQPRVYENNIYVINQPPGFPKFFYPIIIAPSETYFVGTYENVFYVPASDLTAETTITDAQGNVYIVFPDLTRNDWRYWHAIKQE